MPGYDDGYLHTTYKDHTTKFPRDINEKLVVYNGTYSREKNTLVKFKYTDKVRLCLGVAVVTPVIDGVEQPQEGRRWKPFIYSGKTLLSMMEFEKKVQNKIAWFKGLKGDHTSEGVTFNFGAEDNICLDDHITKLKNVALQRHANYISSILD